MSDQAYIAQLEAENEALKKRVAELSLLQHVEANINQIVRSIPDIIFIMDTDGNYIDFKAGDGEVFITSIKGHVKGSNIKDHGFDADFIDAIMNHINTAIDTGEIHTYKYELTFPNGEIRFYESRAVRLHQHLALRIVRDFTNLEQQQQALLHTQQALLHAHEKLKEYAFMVSHNLRLPITNILGISHLVKEGLIKEDEQHFYVQQLAIQCDKLNEISTAMARILAAYD